MPPAKSSREECKPLKTFPELLSWTKPDDWAQLTRPLIERSEYCYAGREVPSNRRPPKINGRTAPKTLVCHDFKGGYLDDRFVGGVPYVYQYVFYNWSAVDSFVYFSHHLVTIPPLMWINAAHMHGVKILGTFITEFVAGELIWEVLFADNEKFDKTISNLIKVCESYNFDGYLLNIENKIPSSYSVKLIEFVQALKNGLPGKLIIWYDSVSLITGELRWQNELNVHNKEIFRICDGIFLNYGWTEENLTKSVQNAGCRVSDVYVGVDVFGRGCFGGGGFNSDKAAQKIRNHGLSMALFAPGWTYETQASDQQFFEVDRKFWAKLWPYMYVHWPKNVPFQTSFCIGITTKEVDEMKILWYDLSDQDWTALPACLDYDIPCLESAVCSSIIGGNKFACMEGLHRLLFCEFPRKSERPLKLIVDAKRSSNKTPFKVKLITENETESYTVVLIMSEEQDVHIDEGDQDYSYSIEKSMEPNSTKKINVDEDGWFSNEYSLSFIDDITEIVVEAKETVIIRNVQLAPHVPS